MQPLVAYCLERDTFLRSVKTALVVGTILALINHGQQFLSGEFAASWIIPMFVTYLVPFTVATYGQVQGKRQRDRLQENVPALPNYTMKNSDKTQISLIAERETLPLSIPFWEEHQASLSLSKSRLQFAPRVGISRMRMASTSDNISK